MRNSVATEQRRHQAIRAQRGIFSTPVLRRLDMHNSPAIRRHGPRLAAVRPSRRKLRIHMLRLQIAYRPRFHLVNCDRARQHSVFQGIVPFERDHCIARLSLSIPSRFLLAGVHAAAEPHLLHTLRGVGYVLRLPSS